MIIFKRFYFLSKNIIYFVIRPCNLKFIFKRTHDIFLSYSELHFHPEHINKFQNTSASQLASHIYSTLLKIGQVKYADNPDFEKTKILFTANYRYIYQNIKAKKIIFFPATSHKRYTKNILIETAKKLNLTQKYFDRLDSEDNINIFQTALNKADLIILIGNHTIEDTYIKNGIHRSKIITLNYGVNHQLFNPANRNFDKIIFIYPVTFFTLLKGFPILLAAWKHIQTLYSNIELVIIGSKDNSDFDISLIPENITYYHDYICGSDLHIQMLNKAHYVIFPSLSEGQAGTLLEAMSCGCVPIATKESGIDPENYNGWEIKAGDIEDLIIKWIRVIEIHNKENWISRSNNTRKEIIEKHSWEIFCNNILINCLKIYNL